MDNYLYLLNFPRLVDIVDKAKLKKITEDNNFFLKRHISLPSDSLFTKEWTNICGIEFDKIYGFLKINSSGTIHVDDTYHIREKNQPPVWGINWFFQGEGKYEFWEPSSIDSYKTVPDAVGTYNLRCVTEKSSDQTYIVNSDKPILFNASIPHRATGVGMRYCFSLRPKDVNTFTWNDIKNIFSSYIIN